MTAFGEHDASLPELFTDAAKTALADAGVGPGEVEALFLGNSFGGEMEGQSHLGPLVASYLGVPGIPVSRIEDACASSSNAFRQAVRAVETGRHEVVLVGGVERTSAATGRDTAERTRTFGAAADGRYEQPVGVTFPGVFALVSRRSVHDGLYDEREMASVAVKNHANGSMNPRAHLRNEIAVDDVLDSPVVASPLKLYDCCPFTDGASAAVVTTPEYAASLRDDPVTVRAVEQATGRTPLHDKPDLTELDTVERAGQRAYEAAGLTPADVDVLEAHDCFTSAEIMATEALGFFEKGSGGRAAAEGLTALDGVLPVNPSGGLKSKGHPVGATGVAQIVEITEQLRGESGERRVADARIGMTQNLGGDFGTCVVSLLEAAA